ncbi:MAG: hypothetical protein QOI47_32 [Actinomycetota bacterium]|nr:hypothetical protein [Actinomycetota bacterium]
MVVAVLAVSGAAFGLTRGGTTPGAVRAPSTMASTSTTTRSTTPSTLAAPAPTIDPRSNDGVLESGEHGDGVAAVQRRLGELHFDPGPVDGAFGAATAYAVEGFQNLSGMKADGKVGPEVLAALANPPAWAPLVPDGEPNRVEVDLSRQLLFLYAGGEIKLISHVSTGSGAEYCSEGTCGRKAITRVGAFRFMWRFSGWHESPLGKLYNPVFFTNDGIAVHGATSVPTYPASHGCVRIPMHIAEYFPTLVKAGDAVYVLSGPGTHVGAPPPRSRPPGPPPADPPTSPDTTPDSSTSTTSTTTTSSTTSTSTTTVPVP